jgi:hypothetical protein
LSWPLSVASNNIPSYVERDVDEEFRRLIAAGGFVLLVGDSTAGKSRAAYEAIQAMRSSDVLLVPRSRGDIAAAVAHARGVKRCLLWLDDLERYIGQRKACTPTRSPGCWASAREC